MRCHLQLPERKNHQCLFVNVAPLGLQKMKEDKKRWRRRSHRLKIYLMTFLRWLKQKVKTDPQRKNQLLTKQRPLREGGEEKSQSREFK